MSSRASPRVGGPKIPIDRTTISIDAEIRPKTPKKKKKKEKGDILKYFSRLESMDSYILKQLYSLSIYSNVPFSNVPFSKSSLKSRAGDLQGRCHRHGEGRRS
jgi:hypothetical protein